MQKIASQIFIYSSVVFGFLGILLVLTSPSAGEHSSSLNTIIVKLLMATVFIILPSFALSVAGKYLNGKS
ncbi:MAG: hypothetical protein ABI716_01315 [Candidatus Saccharibacteria bacterium]